MKKTNQEDISDLLVDFQQELKDDESGDNALTFIPKDNNYLIEHALTDYNNETNIEPIPKIFTINNMINDFQQVRDDMIVLINASKEMLAKIPMTIITSKPSMVTAIATMSNSINSNGKLLIELHEKILKMQKDVKLMEQGINPDQPNSTNITNNNLIVNTKDLNSIIEDIINKKRTD